MKLFDHRSGLRHTGYVKHHDVLREQALRLRAQGYSYSEIWHKLPVSQSTISLWCRNVPLTTAQKKRLKRLEREGAARARARWNEIRRQQKAEILKVIANETRVEVGPLTRRDRFIAGVTLYAGEGDRSGERVGISNADPRVLRFELDWLCEFLHIDRRRFTAHLYLHRGRSELKAKKFWKGRLEIEFGQFQKSYRPVPRKSHKGNIHEYGVCAVRANNKMAHRRIMGWIRAVLDNHNAFPGSSVAEQLAVAHADPE